MSNPVNIDTALLRKILAHEVQGGYGDRAVIGGMDRFILTWFNSNRSLLPAAVINSAVKSLRLNKAGYAGKNSGQRQEWISSLLMWLDDLERSSSREGAFAPAARAETTVKPAARSVAAGKAADLDFPVIDLSGVGEKTAVKLEKLGVRTIRDMLYFFPRRYLDFSQHRKIAELEVGQEQTVIANLWESRVTMLGRMRSTEATLGDETGNIRAVWFNQPYLATSLKANSSLVLSGRVGQFHYSKVMENPEWEYFDASDLSHTGRLVPVYPLTRGLYPRQLRTIVKRVVDRYGGCLDEFLPPGVRQRCQLFDLITAVTQAHYPDDRQSEKQARQRLAFDELLLLQIGVLGRKREWQQDQPGHKFTIDKSRIGKFTSSLPFKLTSAQEKVIGEILSDLSGEVPMSRLLQGDVGSGKTVVAMISLLAAVYNGFQGALMAPTEILAEQHFATIHKLIGSAGGKVQRQGGICTFEDSSGGYLRIALLTGSLPAKEKRDIHAAVGEGEIDIIMGTHALIQQGVEFRALGLAVIDEQHRFGVLQRSALRQKGYNPHLLVMTATPIPRTLALTLYGDLDISTISEMPPGRQPIRTRWVQQQDRERAYSFIRKQVAEGRQAFIICPMIEESESLDVKAAVAEHQFLSNEVFPDLKLGLLHGKMKGAAKDAVMQDFKNRNLHILVSTSVVEVGIDVPNATVMLVEAADRFGLAQLHQFRGRVGRGEYQSHCLLLAENPSAYGQERLKAIEVTTDGFKLAEKDLELRGPGDFFGTRQSGIPELKMARLSDVELLEIARREAKLIFADDPRLETAENRLLSVELQRRWQKAVENN